MGRRAERGGRTAAARKGAAGQELTAGHASIVYLTGGGRLRDFHEELLRRLLSLAKYGNTAHRKLLGLSPVSVARGAAYAGTIPGLPFSTTKLALVVTGAPGRLTYSSTR